MYTGQISLAQKGLRAPGAEREGEEESEERGKGGQSVTHFNTLHTTICTQAGSMATEDAMFTDLYGGEGGGEGGDGSAAPAEPPGDDGNAHAANSETAAEVNEDGENEEEGDDGEEEDDDDDEESEEESDEEDGPIIFLGNGAEGNVGAASRSNKYVKIPVSTCWCGVC